ncbi:type I restriction enzyme S subunit [Phyllobacterium trifolii]|uniref:Type I restriction enzyme S subunit n=1 Tax=Phyllobacterium trifolii TaxID=300193 RepID=A0A839UCZ5_9HYPH|nr:restriction endonuclease subunit S [Phyllobacterium trifolii]MBB3147744.1 type I restriction enzyme S subunit [Phyllobacterium trifolii]
MKPTSGALRYFARIRNGTTPASGEAEYWDGDVKWATPEDLGKLTTDRITETKRMVTEKAVEESNLSILPIGSIIISTRAPIGHMAINDAPMAFNQGCRGIVPGDRVYGPFLYYFLKSLAPELNAMANGTTFVELSRDELAAVPVAFPPLETQRRIARFLDEKTSRIDGLIEKKRALLDRLAEKRQTLITRAVTKGLNPDAPMKPSGIDWLGGIPLHWERQRLKEVCKEIIDCKNRTPPNVDDGEYFVIRTSCLGGGQFNPAGGYWTDEESFAEWTKKGTPQENDVLISREAPMGEACLFPEGYMLCLGQRMMLARADPDKIHPYFLLLNIYSDVGREFVDLRKKGTTVGHLRVPEVFNFPVMVPPIAEQREIVIELRRQLESLREVECRVARSLEKLEEYRSALTTAAVTGKIVGLQ